MSGNEIKIKLTIDGKDAIGTLNITDSKLEEMLKRVGKTNDTFSGMTNSIKTVASALGIAFGAHELVGFAKEAITASAELEVLRSTFKGTAEDIEIFKKATAGTVSEKNLIKLSNQATDLGLSMREQAILFALAEDAGDKYGVSIEEAFQKVVFASEGNTKGLKMLGIQKAIFEEIVHRLAAAEGEEIEKLDAETQKRIRLQAVLQASGADYDLVTNKVQDAKDRIEAFYVSLEELKIGFGEILREGLPGMIEMLGAFGYQGQAGLAMMEFNDIMSETLRIMKMFSQQQIFKEAVSLAGEQAENAAKKKSTGQIEEMINRAKSKIDAIKKMNESLTEDQKNDIDQLEQKIEVWSAIIQKYNYEKNKQNKDTSLIKTDEQLKKEIEITKQKLSQAKSAREIIEYIERIIQLEKELSKGTPSLPTSENESSNKPGAKPEGPMKYLPENYEKPVAVTETTSGLEFQYSTMLLLNDEWSHFGQIISQSLARGISHGEKLNETLQKIGETLLETGLELMITIGLKALMVSLGVPPVLFANGGVINEPVAGVGLMSGRSYSFGEAGIPEIVLPSNKIASLNSYRNSVDIAFPSSVEFKVRGHDLYAVVSTIQKRIKKLQ